MTERLPLVLTLAGGENLSTSTNCDAPVDGTEATRKADDGGRRDEA